MSDTHRRLLPLVTYACVLAGAAYLYYLAANFDFMSRPGAPGPDAWPKGILALTIIACVVGIVNSLRARPAPEETPPLIGVGPEGAEPSGELLEAPAQRYPRLLLGGIVATLGYVFFVDKLGFFLTTLLYLVSFLLLGRYRQWRVIAAVSLGGSLLLMYVFMKIVYVSLPLGAGPFAQFSIALMKLMGIR